MISSNVCPLFPKARSFVLVSGFTFMVLYAITTVTIRYCNIYSYRNHTVLLLNNGYNLIIGVFSLFFMGEGYATPPINEVLYNKLSAWLKESQMIKDVTPKVTGPMLINEFMLRYLAAVTNDPELKKHVRTLDMSESTMKQIVGQLASRN